MKTKLKSLKPFIAAALCGILLMFAFAPFSVFPLAIIAMTGLCALIYHANPRRSFWLGFSFGAGLFGTGIYWVYISISRYGDVPGIIALFITACLIAYMSVFPAVACYLTNRYFSKDARSKVLYAFPAIWVLTEWVRSWAFTGFPWLLIGYSQTNSPLKGYAPILSVYGISLALTLTGGLIVNAIMESRRNHYLSMYKNLFAVAIIWILGALLSLIPWTQPTGKPVTVSLVQGNIPQTLKWDPDNIALSFTGYTKLTEPLWGKSDIIIWPETAIPVPLQDVRDFVNDLSEHAKKSGSQLIFGIPVQTPEEDGYYSAVVTVGKYQSAYVKRQLVPFGEYVPLQSISARVLDFMNVPMSNMKAGRPHQAPLTLGNIKILPSICYEITYPELSMSRDKAISMLLTITNDAWFDRSTAQAQHLQMAAMRSIEMARPSLFVSNDGITAIIDTNGNVTSSAPTHVAYVLQGSVQSYTGLTPWMGNGIDPLLVILLVMLFVSYRSKRKAAQLNHASASVTQ